MKRYIKPNIEVFAVQIESIMDIASPAVPQVNNTPASQNALSGEYDDAKQTNISSNSLWDEEE
jgi:hypothetical protein